MVDVELEDSVARIFLNRPEKANALNSAMLAALTGALQNLDPQGLRVAVIAGRGRNFCGGADAPN
jgi:enoyl-CoA hydratase/carnithine racemase